MATRTYIAPNGNRPGNGYRLRRKDGNSFPALLPLTRRGRTPELPNQQEKEGPRARLGSIRLDQKGYASPHNDVSGVIQLHLNENLFSAARAALEREQPAELVRASLSNLHIYPAGGVKQLQDAVAAHLKVGAGNIVVAYGSAELLRNLFFYLLKKDETILLPAPGWSFYNAVAAFVEARVATFPLVDNGRAFSYDRQIIADHIEACRPKVVLICSPNNPTGNILPIEDFFWLVGRYPQVNFILDEAYYGFCDLYSPAQEKALLEVAGRKNVYVVRTFSKFYGLANLRVGFLICRETAAAELNKIAPMFGMPTFSQELAIRRLADRQYERELKQEFAAVNTYTTQALHQIPGLTPYQSCANFILVRHDRRWWGLEDTLLRHGYLIKRESINGATNYFRITYADLSTMQGFIAVVRSLSPGGVS